MVVSGIIIVQGWADKSVQLFSRSSSMDIARNKGGNGMKVLGFIHATVNNILTLNMTTFICYDCINATAEPRDCVDNLGLIYRINILLDTSFESNYVVVWLQTCLAYNSLPEVIIYGIQIRRI